MYNLCDVKKSIKSNPRCFIYRVLPNNNFNLIGETNGKNDAKEFISSNYDDDKEFFIVAKIVFHTAKKFGQAGPFAVHFDLYKITNNKLVNLKYEKSKLNRMKGAIWFSLKFIEKKGWSNKYIDNIISKLLNSNIVLMPEMLYHVEFI